MKNIKLCIKQLVLVSMLVAAMSLFFTPMNAQAEIEELIIGIGIDADTLLPYDQTTTLMQNMADLIYDSYFYQDPDSKLHPRLATKYEVSEDGLTYTIHLRKGVKFSDGTDFNADAVKQAWDNILNPKARVPLRFAVGMVKECVKIDDHTIALKLKFAFAPLAPTISMSLVSPISPAALKKYGENIRQNPTGAGPYILHKWVKGDRIEMILGQKTHRCENRMEDRARSRHPRGHAESRADPYLLQTIAFQRCRSQGRSERNRRNAAGYPNDFHGIKLPERCHHKQKGPSCL
jgi:ABC-type transport system substrate-binding protein